MFEREAVSKTDPFKFATGRRAGKYSDAHYWWLLIPVFLISKKWYAYFSDSRVCFRQFWIVEARGFLSGQLTEADLEPSAR